MTTTISKQSYTIPCSTKFRDVVIELAERRSVNVADLARSILLVLPEDIIKNFSDPGEPQPKDREQAILKSGPSKGRPWRRKPRLQVRLTPGYDISFVRRALNLAVFVDNDHYLVNIRGLEVDASDNFNQGDQNIKASNLGAANQLVQDTVKEKNHDRKRLREVISALAFTPRPDGLSNRIDALHVMGFFPSERPDLNAIRSKFKLLARIHHPDNNYGSHQRMIQLNAAMDLLGSYEQF
jgi:hypothetical protein